MLPDRIHDLIGMYADGLQFSAIFCILFLFLFRKKYNTMHSRLFIGILFYFLGLGFVKFIYTLKDVVYEYHWHYMYVIVSLALVPLFESLIYSLSKINVTNKSIIIRLALGEFPYIVLTALFASENQVILPQLAYVYTWIYLFVSLIFTMLRVVKYNKQIQTLYPNQKNINYLWVNSILPTSIFLMSTFTMAMVYLGLVGQVSCDIISVIVLSIIAYGVSKHKVINQ